MKRLLYFANQYFYQCALLTLLVVCSGARGATTLSDIPLFSASNVPANLMLALSVEWPTGVVAAYTEKSIPQVYTDNTGVTRNIYCAGANSAGHAVCYYAQMHYLGYFDWNKCYTYSTTNKYFSPVSMTYTTGVVPTCGPTNWSGNFLNWATMTKLDEVRMTLTGGYRFIDTSSLTVLQRSRDTGQGSSSSPPTRQVGLGNSSCTTPGGTTPTYSGCAAGTMAPSTLIGDAAFSAAANVYIRSNGATGTVVGTDAASAGVLMEISDNSSWADSGSGCTSNCQHDRLYYVRVQVCVAGLLESNCNSAHAQTDYPGAGIYNKPEGLIQQNFQRIRVGATAYVRSSGVSAPNGMLRALLHDNGPTTYNGFGTRQANTSTTSPGGQMEWDPNTGIFTPNPDPVSAAASGVTSSGTINYLNQFGYVEPNYESNDTVSELYWATLAYYKNLPLDSSYTSGIATLTATQLDNFPAIVSQNAINDPIQYACQGNTIVTFGDSHTWYDTAVPGAYSLGIAGHAPLASIAANNTDPGLNTQAYVQALGNLPLIEQIGSTPASQTMSQYAGVDISTSKVVGNGTSGDTYNLAGMAYYAHTQDIRGDNPSYTNPTTGLNSTIGMQTVDTYSVDVMEPGPFDGSSSNPTYYPTKLSSGDGPNQYWLMAKYGGFSVDNTQCTSASPLVPCTTVVNAGVGTKVPTPETFLSWHTNTTQITSTNNDLRPDNYFPGNRPDLIQSGLGTIFNRLSSTAILSASAPGVSQGRLLSPVVSGDEFNSSVAGFPIYTTNYRPGDWTGEVNGYVGYVTNGTILPVTGTVTWSAQTQLDNLTQALNSASTPAVVGWNLARRIITYNSSTKLGVPFRYGSLSSSQQAALPGDSSASSPLLNFLRGDKSNEGTLFRVRRHVLGDIVDSSAVLVQGALSPAYGAANPGYSSFASNLDHSSTNMGRAPVVYVGGNDGMLHAFAADFSVPTSGNPLTGGGSELFAYVPSPLFNGPTSPTVDGLAALANLNGVTANSYTHHFYVDQTPVAADVDFDFTCTTPQLACTRGSSWEWHTVLAGSLGKGGKGIYALDITTPATSVSLTSSVSANAAIETTIANSAVLWEFTDADMGFTYGRPVFAKTRKYGWVVLITSGYNNSSGHGHLYVLNPKTGLLLERLDTPDTGTALNPSGLGRASAYTQDLTDGTIEQVYAGDLLGNVWRFDLSGSASGAYPAPQLFAKLTDPSGNPQPITTAPGVELDIDNTGLNTRRWVFVGTGQFLSINDLTNSQQQTMYALRDGTGSVPSTIGSTPLSRTTTGMQQANLTGNLNLSDTAAGWYYDLPGKAPVAGGATERIIVDPDAVAGSFVVAWTSMIPTADPCSYHGATYAAGFGSGQSALSVGGSLVSSVTTTTGAPTGVQIVQKPGDTGYSIIIPGTANTSPSNPIQIQSLSSSGAGTVVTRTNWREIFN